MRNAELLAILDAGPLPHAFMTRAQRRAMQAGVDSLIDYLDAVAPDADLEDDETEDEADREPSLGSPEVEFSDLTGRIVRLGHIDQRHWYDGRTVSPALADLEADTADDEPSLGVPEHAMSVSYGHGVDRVCDQTSWVRGYDSDEREVEDEHGGDINDEREGDGDPDGEPSLGAPDGRASQVGWSDGSSDGRERDDDFEPTLGVSEGMDHQQGLWGRIGGACHENEEDERGLPDYREGMAILAEQDRLARAA